MLKIVKNKIEKEFSSLCPGNTFIDTRGKIYIVLSNNVVASDGDVCNTYCFNDNDVYFFGAYEVVTPVNITLTYDE